MYKPHSLELKKNVIACIKGEGCNISATAQKFGISRKTVSAWVKRYELFGNCNPILNVGRRATIDKCELKRYMALDTSATLDDVAKHFGVSYRVAQYHVHQCGLSFVRKPRKKLRA